MDEQPPLSQKPILRSIETSDLGTLSAYQPGKNRGYTQLQNGKLTARFNEVFLGDAQVFRETLDVGARIEAVPDSRFLPFAYIYPHSGDYKFCGYQRGKNTLAVASGGAWEVMFKDKIDYISVVFEREFFYKNYEILTGKSVTPEQLDSKLLMQDCAILNQYQIGVSQILHYAKFYPYLLDMDHICRLFSSQALKLVVDAISTPTVIKAEARKNLKRDQGVKRVVDYLHAHANQLPDMTTLCEVACLSERSLQYGFKNYIGLTPVQYLRVVRLNGARQSLMQGTKSTTSVATIALTWGFVEFGRFSKEYKALFHELPSETLAS